MIVAFVLLLVIAAHRFDWLWLPALFCAVAAMHWVASLHFADPLASLYAFLGGGIAARLTLALVADFLKRRMA